MSGNLLDIKDLRTSVEDKEINILMGHPKYKLEDGSITFQGEVINDLKTNERAKRGLFLSFQYTEEVPGIRKQVWKEYFWRKYIENQGMK